MWNNSTGSIYDIMPRKLQLRQLIGRASSAPLSHLSQPTYRADIDGLRALAVLSVVGFHAFPTLIKGGFIGVDVFFVISGFLISTIIFENLERETFSFSEFYARRVRRIFPALIAVLLACFGFGWLVLLADELNQLGKHIAAGAGFISNLLLWSEAGYFDNSAETKPLLHLWSLGIEEQFYIIWPFAAWFAWKNKFNLLVLVVAVATISFYLNLKWIQQDPIATFYSPLTRFWELLCGSILAWFMLHKKNSFVNLEFCQLIEDICPHELKFDRGALSNVVSISGSLLLAYGYWIINRNANFPGMWALLPTLGTVLIILAGPGAWINRKILSNKIPVWIGLMSFPLYLWHWPLLSFARIIGNGSPSSITCITAVALSGILASLTVKWVEKPLRAGIEKNGLKVVALCGLMFAIGIGGLIVSKVDYSQSRSYGKLAIERKGFEYAFGSSLNWYRGRNDWLYLGNGYDNTVAKLKLAILPTDTEIQATRETFRKIAVACNEHNVTLALFVGPNKSSIYPEYLPEGLVPSNKKYSSFFLDNLRTLPNLTVYDPTNELISLKKSEGLLYWMTDTHWNNKGAFLAYSGFLKLFGLPIPNVEFRQGSTHSGDLIAIAKLSNFPLHAEDNWDVIMNENPLLKEMEIQNEQDGAFGSNAVVLNDNPISNKYVWVVGDSFSSALRPYFNATFKEVRYVGHWFKKLNDLPSELLKADRKPDMIVIVRVERSF